jgi:hypothetical protein
LTHQWMKKCVDLSLSEYEYWSSPLREGKLGNPPWMKECL